MAGDAASAGTVALRDAAGQRLVSSTDAQDAFQFDVTGLSAPFTVKAKLRNGKTLAAVADGPGVVSVDPLSTVAFRGSGSGSGSDDDGPADSSRQAKFSTLLAQLRTVMAPLFECYGITATTGPRDAAWKKLFAEVRFEIEDGVLTVTNRQSGSIIFTGQVSALSQGTFTAANLPAHCTGTAAPAACTSISYSDWGACQADGTQSRTVTSVVPSGCDQSAAVLTQACSPTPVACTSFTYTDWGACQANGTQTRTATGVPAGCTGTPDQPLSQSCTPPTTATLSAVSVSPASVTGGASSTGTVTLTASAPSGGTAVTLASSSASASVPASVTVAAGATTATFAVATTAVTAATTVTVTASAGGVTRTASLTVNAPAPLVCSDCHGAAGPTTGRHVFHVQTQGYACSTCHGTGYSFTAQTVNTATHRNGTVDVTVANWDPVNHTCGGCHTAGSRTW